MSKAQKEFKNNYRWQVRVEESQVTPGGQLTSDLGADYRDTVRKWYGIEKEFIYSPIPDETGAENYHNSEVRPLVTSKKKKKKRQ